MLEDTDDDNELFIKSNNNKGIIELESLSKEKINNDHNQPLRKKILTKSYNPKKRYNIDNFEKVSLQRKNTILKKKLFFSIIEFIFVFLLLMSSSFNFNFLYFPYIILGIILSFYLKCKVHKKCKILSGIFGLIYSLLLLIFKMIIVIKKEYILVEKYKYLLINLGIQILKDKISTLIILRLF